MSSFIAGARSQLQLITEHRAGGTRSAFRSALSLHFAINPFHTIPHHRRHHSPPHPHPKHTLAHSISLPVFILSRLYFHFSADFSLNSAFSAKSLFSQPATSTFHLSRNSAVIWFLKQLPLLSSMLLRTTQAKSATVIKVFICSEICNQQH